MNTVRQKILKLLNTQNMTQRELAEKCGVTEACISKYTTSGRLPRVDILNNIAKAFNVTMDSFFDSNDNNIDLEKKIIQVVTDIDVDKSIYLGTIPLDSESIKLLRNTIIETLSFVKSLQELRQNAK